MPKGDGESGDDVDEPNATPDFQHRPLTWTQLRTPQGVSFLIGAGGIIYEIGFVKSPDQLIVFVCVLMLGVVSGNFLNWR